MFLYHLLNKQSSLVEPLMHILLVCTPAGVDLVTKNRVKDGQVVITGQTIHVDLKVVEMTNFDVMPKTLLA